MQVKAVLVGLCAIAIMGGCAAPPEPAGPSSPEPPSAVGSPSTAMESCPIRGGFVSQGMAATVATLRAETEEMLLFQIPAAEARETTCRVDVDTGGIWLAYAFGPDAWLRVQHDRRTAYTSREAQFVLPPGEHPVRVLQQVERVAFGADGCGIDWRTGAQGDVAAGAGDAPGPTQGAEEVFRGSRCHCYARIRRGDGAAGLGFLFRESC